MPACTFPDQVQSNLINLCHLFNSCNQRYALHRSDDGHYAQLIFGADLARTQRTSNAITELLTKHFIAFEEQLGTGVKLLAFFMRDLFANRTLAEMKVGERRLFLSNIHDKLFSLDCSSIIQKNQIDIEALTGHILDTFPRPVFDQKGIYHSLLSRLVQHNLDQIDDYLNFNQQLSFVTIDSSLNQSRLIDGILIPIHNSTKLLPSLISNKKINIFFLNLSSFDDEQSSFTIIDHNQQFYRFDAEIYRRFVNEYLIDVNLLISFTFINQTFLFELQRAGISVIDALDEKTFEFLLKIYSCSPCNRLLLAKDESIEKISTTLFDRHVIINQQAYLHLDSNDRHQTLISTVPTSILMLSTQKILINIVRLVRFVLQQSSNFVSERDYLRYISEHIHELRHILEYRRIYLDKNQINSFLPISIFREILLNGIHFLCYINKIDGIYCTKKRREEEKKELIA